MFTVDTNLFSSLFYPTLAKFTETNPMDLERWLYFQNIKTFWKILEVENWKIMITLTALLWSGSPLTTTPGDVTCRGCFQTLHLGFTDYHLNVTSIVSPVVGPTLRRKE